MLIQRHLQKIFFTTDEAHGASHPDRFRWELWRPIQRELHNDESSWRWARQVSAPLMCRFTRELVRLHWPQVNPRVSLNYPSLCELERERWSFLLRNPIHNPAAARSRCVETGRIGVWEGKVGNLGCVTPHSFQKKRMALSGNALLYIAPL